MASAKKILIVHRDYRARGGEEAFLENILEPALKRLNLPFKTFRLPALFSENSLRDFLEIIFMTLGFEKLRPSYKAVMKAVESEKATDVLFNNFAPVISLDLPSSLKSRDIQTLWWLHNSRFDCANGIHFNGHQKCKRCLYNGSRWSFIYDCQKNFFQSLIYALAYARRRVPRKVIPSIDLFICNSRYTQKNLEETLKKLTLHATSEIISMPTSTALHESSDEGVRRLEKVVAQIPRPFYLFLGRVTFDKGADVFAELARRFPDRGFLVCGEGPLVKELKSLGFRNLTFAGKIGEEKSWAFQNCEALIIPSRSPETSSLIIAESHPYGTPVVYPSGGGAEETFKALKRSGCPLEEFKGQNFVKSESTQGFSNSDFDKSLASCLDR